MDDYLPDDYRKVIADRIKKHSEYLSKGKAENFERYREVVGILTGLKEALEDFNKCVQMRGGEISDD